MARYALKRISILIASIVFLLFHLPTYAQTSYGGPFLYTSQGSGNVAGYAVNTTTGALTTITGSPWSSATSGALPDGGFVTVDPLRRFLYVVTLNNTVVVGFTINPSTGVLTEIAGSPFATPVSSVALGIDPSGSYLFLVDDYASLIGVMEINGTTGALSSGATYDSGASGFFGVAAHPNGQYVYFASNAGPIAGFSIGTGGVLTAITGSPFTVGRNLSSLVIDPTGSFLYAADTEYGDGGNIYGYTIQSNGALVPISGSPWASIRAPSLLGMDPTGRFLYSTATYLNGELAAYTIDPTTGALTAISGSPYSLSAAEFQIVVDPTGQWAYTSGWLYSNDIYAWSINNATGALTDLSTPLTASNPTGLAMTGIPKLALVTVFPSSSSATPSQTLPVLVTLSGGIGNATPTGLVVLSSGSYSSDPTTLASGRATITIPANKLAPGSDKLTATYTPDTASSSSYATASGSASVTVSAPVVSLNYTALTFTAVSGATSSAQSATLTNAGNSPLTINSISLTGTNTSSFGESNTCTSPVAAGASCSISVTFSPAATGSFSASVNISDNAAGSPHTIGLNGTGTAPPTFSLSASPSTQTIANTATATYTVTVSAVGGTYSSPVTLSASGNPANTSITFNPSSVTPGATSGTSTMTIGLTSKPTALRSSLLWKIGMPALTLAGLVLLPMRLRRRQLITGVLVVVALTALAALSGCGSKTVIPSGSYTITITGTSGSIQKTTVQMVVQ